MFKNERVYTGNFWILFFLNFFLMLNQNFMNIMPAYLNKLKANEAAIGLYQIVGNIILLVFIVLVTIRPIRSTRRTWVMAGYAAGACAYILMFLFPASIPVLYATRLLTGVCYAFGFSLLYSMMYDIVPAAKHVSAAALYGISGLITNAIASSISEIIYKNLEVRWIFVSPLVVAVAALVLIFFVAEPLPGKDESDTSKKHFFSQLRHHRSALPAVFLTLVFGGVYGLLWSFIGRITDIRLHEVNIMAFFQGFTIIGLTGRLLIMGFLDKADRSIVFILSFLCLAVSLVLLLFVQQVWQLYIIGIFYGIAHTLLFPSLSAFFVGLRIVNRTVSSNIFLFLFTAGTLLTTQVIGACADLFGYDPAIVVIIIISLGAAILSLLTPGFKSNGKKINVQIIENFRK